MRCCGAEDAGADTSEVDVCLEGCEGAVEGVSFNRCDVVAKARALGRGHDTAVSGR